MKFKCLILFILSITIAKAQQIHLKGNIVDAKTNQPIAAATISIQAKELYYPADNNGKFDITTDSLIANDSVSFSCIGYQTKKVKTGDLFINATTKLEPSINILQEVSIRVKPIIKVGSKYPFGKYSIPLHPGFDQASYMDGSKNVKGIIQSVGFYLGNGVGIIKGGDITAPFRIRIFSVDIAGMPGKELTNDLIVVHGEKDNSWFDVDISAYHIQNPDSGFYASFTLLTDEYYKLKSHVKGASDSLSYQNEAADIVTPRLGMMKGKHKPQRSYFSVHIVSKNSDRRWIKDYFNFSYLIRATIAPE